MQSQWTKSNHAFTFARAYLTATIILKPDMPQRLHSELIEWVTRRNYTDETNPLASNTRKPRTA
jgi:hypothetical protein